MVRCTIKVESNGRAICQAGQTMNGVIQLFFDEPKKIRGLYFVVHGAAECDWTMKKKETSGLGENRKSLKQILHFVGKDVYLNTHSYLLGSSDGDVIEITRGMHKFDFSCRLPSELPASFEASHGHINYYIEAVLDVPLGNDRRFREEFSVVRCDDLNEFPELKLQTESEEIKHFCQLFRKSKPLLMTISLSHTGYVPGETAEIFINYVNNSHVNVQSTQIQLIRIIRFNSQTPKSNTKIETDVIFETFTEGVERLSRKQITKRLVVPKVMLTSNEKYCDIVQVSYVLQVKAKVSSFHRKIKLNIPITIGSVPIINVQRQPQTASKILHVEIENFAEISTPLLTESPPPTFDEAIKMNNSAAPSSSKCHPIKVRTLQVNK